MPSQFSTRPPNSPPANLRLSLGLLSLALCGLLGCSSSEPEPAAPDPAAVAPVPTIAMDIKKVEPSDGEAYGGGTYGSDASREEEDEFSMGMQRGPMGPGGPGGFAMQGYPDGFKDDGDGMMEGMPGFDMPGFGMSASATPQFASAMQFVRTNCIHCHGPQKTEGDMRLDLVSDDFTNMGNATTWHSVLKQLEDATMPPPTVPRRPDARQQSAVVAWIKSSLVKADFVPLEERDYLTQAEYAFSVGNEGKAVELLYAHAVAADDSVAHQTLSQARWFELGLRPILALRFAVGADLDAEDSIDDLKPLGVSQSGGAGGGGRAGNMAFGSQSSTGANTKSERTFQELTGDFGDALVASFESRWMEGKLGTPFKDVEPATVEVPNNNAMGMMGMGGMKRGMEDMLGDFPGSGVGADGNAATSKHTTQGSILTPGLVFIGTGKQSELLKEAIAQGFDGLFLFDIKAAHKRRGGLIENSTRLRFVGLDGKTVAATSTLVNIDIERAKLRGHEDDTLSKNIDRFFAGFDSKAKLSELPALKPEHAHDRIRALLVDPQTDDLVKLFEARLYRSMDLLSADELAKVYQIILRGNEGLALANGTIEDRKLVLNEVIDKTMEARHN
jgi:mono/diheme cytochrome c family protein